MTDYIFDIIKQKMIESGIKEATATTNIKYFRRVLHSAFDGCLPANRNALVSNANLKRVYKYVNSNKVPESQKLNMLIGFKKVVFFFGIIKSITSLEDQINIRLQKAKNKH